MGADYSFDLNSIETYAPQFFGHNNLFLGSVSFFLEFFFVFSQNDSTSDLDNGSWKNSFHTAVFFITDWSDKWLIFAVLTLYLLSTDSVLQK